MSRPVRTSSLLLTLVAVAGIPVAATQAAKPRPNSSSTSALVDSFDGDGELVTARSDAHMVRGLLIVWRNGVSARIPRWTSDRRVASLKLVTDPSKAATFVDLWAKGRSGSAPRSLLRLRARNGPAVAVTLHAGEARPRLEVTDLPAGTTSIEITTIGQGRGLLRITAPCRHDTRHIRTSETIRYGDGTHARTTHKHYGTSCTTPKPLDG